MNEKDNIESYEQRKMVSHIAETINLRNNITRPKLMKELNSLLGTDYNWKRLCFLDLKRLVDAIKKLKKLG